MARIFTAVTLVTFAAFCTAQKPEIQAIGENIEVVEDINVYRTQHPGLNLIPLSAKVNQPLGEIRYNLGQRVIGDRIVAQGNNNSVYPSPQNVQLTLKYPQSGYGAVVTYVEIVVSQTSNDGNAYVVSGNIGERQIIIVVEAKQTYNFSYRSAIYGL